MFALLAQINIHDTPNKPEFLFSYSRHLRSLFILDAFGLMPQPDLQGLEDSLPLNEYEPATHDIDHQTESVLKSLEIAYNYEHYMVYRKVDFFLPENNLVIECEGYGHSYSSRKGEIHYL